MLLNEGSGHRASRPLWLAPLTLFVVALGVFIPTAADSYANWDPYASSVSAWRIATTGQPWMEGVDFDQLTGVKDPTVWQSEIGGHLVTTRMYGPILAAVPFYWLNSYGEEADFSIYRAGMAASVLVACSVLFLFLGARRRAGNTKALIGAAVYGFATPAWSVGANALWTHPMTMFGLAGAALAASRDRWWLAGLSLGIGMWARPHIGLVAAILGLGVAWTRRRPLIAVAIGIPAAVSLMILGAWNHYVFGSWNPLGVYAGHRVTSSVSDLVGQINQFENVAGFLVSPDRGLFVWTPLVLVLMPAVVRSWRCAPDWSRWLAVGGVAYVVLQLGLNYYGGSVGFYGYRHALELLVCVTPLYTFALGSAGTTLLRTATLVVSLQFAIIWPGAVFETFYMNVFDVWTDNSFWYALRNYPEVFGPSTLVCLLAGAYAACRVREKVPKPDGELGTTSSDRVLARSNTV